MLQGTLRAIGLQICLLIDQPLMLDASITAAQSRLNNRSHPGCAIPNFGQPKLCRQPRGLIFRCQIGTAAVEIIWAAPGPQCLNRPSNILFKTAMPPASTSIGRFHFGPKSGSCLQIPVSANGTAVPNQPNHAKNGARIDENINS